MTLDEKLKTKVILKSTCDDCWNMPEYQINRFAKWSKEWYIYYACDKHVSDVIDNRIGLGEFAELLPFDNEGLVQCIDCDNFTPCSSLSCIRHGGECSEGLSLYGYAHRFLRECDGYHNELEVLRKNKVLTPEVCQGKLSGKVGVYTGYYLCGFEGDCRSQYQATNDKMGYWNIVKDKKLCSTPKDYLVKK